MYKHILIATDGSEFSVRALNSGLRHFNVPKNAPADRAEACYEKLVVTISWCLLGILFPVTANFPNAAAQDATAYQEACGDCHPAPAVLARKIKGVTEEEKKAHLTAFLTHHHPPDPATIDRIVSFLFSSKR